MTNKEQSKIKELMDEAKFEMHFNMDALNYWKGRGKTEQELFHFKECFNYWYGRYEALKELIGE